MKTIVKLFLLILGFALAESAVAQPPPNDEFTNRIALTGSSVTWAGNSAGATPDWDLEFTFLLPYDLRSNPNNDIWWSWTAQNSSPVVLEALGVFAKYSGFIAVYSNSDVQPFQMPLCAVDLSVQGQYATFNAEAGHEYQLKFAITETNDVVFRLTATNAPVFRLQPRTQTVYSNAGAFFTSWAVGVKPLSRNDSD